MYSFRARIQIIGINPCVLLPARVLSRLFRDAGKDKGAIPVKGTLNGHEYVQNLVKYSGAWRLYLNGPMRKAAGIDVGDMADVVIAYDAVLRQVPMHTGLAAALKDDAIARNVFNGLAPSRQKEINRYLSFLKTEESVKKNIEKVVKFLKGEGPFTGRDL